MISREEAKELLLKGDRGLLDFIDTIYNSIGSCGECKYWSPYQFCKRIQTGRGSAQSNKDWYCADFERKEDDNNNSNT